MEAGGHFSGYYRGVDALTFHFAAADRFVWFQRIWSLGCLAPGTVESALSAHVRYHLYYTLDANADDEQTHYLSIDCVSL